MSTNIEVQRVCQHCGNTFIARTTVTRYCSHKCNSRAYKAKVRGEKIEVSNTETSVRITKPIEELKAKPFLSITDTCRLLGVSRRTNYRMLERGDIGAGKVGSRTIIQRAEIDKLFPNT